MRKIQFVLMVPAVCAFSAVVATSASAEEAIGWLQSGLALTTAVAVDSAGTLVLEDTDTGTSIECSGTGLGFVGPGVEDLVETMTVSTCKFVKAAECAATSPVTFVPFNLFWATLLELVNGVLLDMIEPGTGGNPELLVECESKTFPGVTIDYKCTAALAYTRVTNEGGFVDILFDKTLAPFANCDTTALGSLILEGKETGLVEGLVELLAESGLEITANAA
jgi:hypothetical protein